MMGVKHLSILPKAVIGHVEETVLNAPVTAHEGQQSLGIGAIGREAGDEVVDALGDLTGGAVHHARSDLGNLG